MMEKDSGSEIVADLDIRQILKLVVLYSSLEQDRRSNKSGTGYKLRVINSHCLPR